MLVEYTMSASIFRHLCGIALLKTYNLDFHEGNKHIEGSAGPEFIFQLKHPWLGSLMRCVDFA